MLLTQQYLKSVLGCLFVFSGTEYYISSLDNINVIFSSFNENIPDVTVEIAKLYDTLALSDAYVSDDTDDTIPFLKMYPINVWYL